MTERKSIGKLNFILLWDKEQIVPLITSLKLAPGTAEYVQFSNAPTTIHTDEHNASGLPMFRPSYPSPKRVMKCSHCNTTFDSREEQVTHYSLDWHRFNLKRSIDGFDSVSQEKFIRESYDNTEDENDSDDISSFDEDDETSDNDEVYVRKQPRIYFINSDNQIVSIFRSVLFNKKSEPSSETEIVQRVAASVEKLYWVVLLIGGGHFAAAVFQGSEVIMHKTFHSYTVRANQGRSQSSRDNKNATSHPRSAGASLRRYNEQCHMQHIQELMSTWSDYMNHCDLVFYRCPKSYHHLIFGGQLPSLSKKDSRIRTIPFVTKRASFSECKKVQRTLAKILLHENLSDFESFEAKPKKIPASKELSTALNCSTKRLTVDKKSVLETQNLVNGNSSSESSPEDVIKMGLTSLNIRDLDPFGSYVEDRPKYKKKKTRKKAESTDNSSETKEIAINPHDRLVENIVYTACRTGDLVMLKAILQFKENKDLTNVSDLLSVNLVEAITCMSDSTNILDFRFGPNQKTLLHVVAEKGHKPFIWWLLENGCDPSISNKNNETPYVATKNKEARNHFRRFMDQYPQKHNYEKAKIPSPLTKSMEMELKRKAVEKKKQQKQVKQNKENELKKETEFKRQQEEEKQRFLQLSDREKRALAAERRMVTKTEASITLVIRCFQCANDISKMVPFQYSDYKFCSTKCVSEHRIKLKS